MTIAKLIESFPILARRWYVEFVVTEAFPACVTPRTSFYPLATVDGQMGTVGILP
jgi:hypothetical protein